MSDDDASIGPSTRVAALLERYPQLEDVLIELAPPFAKLKNPILRRSVARVASLRQAAAAARMPVTQLVNHLRAAVGQAPLDSDSVTEGASYLTRHPAGFDPDSVTVSIDERKGEEPDRMTITRVLPAARALGPTEVLELITDFVPAPGIDILRGNGFEVWSVKSDGNEIRTYVARPAGSVTPKPT
jgi:hypothetical protein